MNTTKTANRNWPDDADAAIAHMHRHETKRPDAALHYEFLSNAMFWTDEWSPEVFSGTMGILMLITHRQCLIDGKPSDLTKWWDYAKSRCPQWIGFLPERQQLSREQTAQLEAARKDAALQWQRHIRPPTH